MASESGFSNQLKKGTSQFKTIHSLGSNKFGQSVAGKALFEKVAATNITSVVDVDGINGQVEFQIVNLPDHGALLGDVLRIDAGDLTNYEFDILEIIDADNFKILALVEAGLLSGVLASIMGWVTSKVNQDGSQIVSLAPTAVAFNRDSVLTEVAEDTTNEANTVGLPVNDNGARTSLGTINTSLVNIPNVITTEGGSQTSHGVMIMGHTGGGVARHIKVSGSGVQDVSISSSVLPTDAATASKQDLLLTELQLKADLTETQPVAPNITRNSGVIDANTTRVVVASDQTLATQNKSDFVPFAYDNITTTYVGATSKIDTVVYKTGITTVATLTMSYDGSDRLISVVRT
jgi:hypothetical protein